jgi:tRNA pseudouridine55 synthase
MIPAPNSFESIEDILQGSVIIVDKPLEWTSFDVVGRLKWLIRRYGKAPKFKIGHAGTLDPLASGLLVVCTGKCTKQIQDIQGGMKEYTGTIRLGQTTPSYDLETAPEGDFPYEHYTEAELLGVAASFLGEQLQTPPIYSAKLIDGKRAYESARAGVEVVMRQALITIHEFELTRIALPDIDFKIRCSKGTYIRSIAHDFGQKLGGGSHLVSLRRTESAPFRIENAYAMQDLEEKIRSISPSKSED